ncbi:MAG: DNA helicase RecQ [Cyclobacteriaceae bacterium]
MTNPLESYLLKHFGHAKFRGEQKSIIQNLLDGNDTFVIMPTGAGKSLCYQLPAIISKGTALIISPLIALMKNQVDQMKGYGIDAAFLNSTLSRSESTQVKKSVLAGDTKLLYVAPESLNKEQNINFFKKVKLSFIAIDEAHCISEWGHDFRPEYRKIKSIAQQLGKLPIIALTATATPKVQLDIIKNLGMEDAKLYKSSFRRKNLFYEVRPKSDAKKQMIGFVNKFKGKSGIVYCFSRKKVEEIAEFLKLNGVNARPYHAGMDSTVRMNNQDAFLNEDADVIVATIAFGMGIDKPDVRFVIHYDAPKSLEGYYQETGRGGRDGQESRCLMFYSYGDLLKLEKLNKDKPVTERDTARNLLEEVTGYAESPLCRAQQLLHYFGEQIKEPCGACDNCLNPKDNFQIKEEASLAIQTVLETKQRFGIKHLVDVIRGSANQYVKSYQHDSLSIYGKGKGKDIAYWTSVFRQLVILEYFEKDIEEIGIIKVTQQGLDYLKSPADITLFKDHQYTDNVDAEVAPQIELSYDKVLLDILKEVRKKVAQEKELPPYVVFQDGSLEEMATTYPTTLQSLVTVNGVGQGKAQKFGASFLQTIEKYIEDNNISVAEDMLIKTTVNKSKLKIQLVQLIDRQMNLEDIATAVGKSYDDLLEEMETICSSGTKLNIDYYIEEVVDEDKEDEIYDYFMEADSDDVSEALEELDEDYSEEEIRLIKIKFLSEVAN